LAEKKLMFFGEFRDKTVATPLRRRREALTDGVPMRVKIVFRREAYKY